jgi:hypothetical protein
LPATALEARLSCIVSEIANRKQKMKPHAAVQAVLFAAALTAMLSTVAAPARADVITLDVSATLTPFPFATCPPSPCLLGGDLVINNSAPAGRGQFVSADVTVSNESPTVGPFTEFVALVSYLGNSELALTDSHDDVLSLVFLTHTPGSIDGYTGSALTSLETIILGPSTALCI